MGLWWVREYNRLINEGSEQALLPQLERISRTGPRVETKIRGISEAAGRPLPIHRRYRDPRSYVTPGPYHGIGFSSATNAGRHTIADKLREMDRGKRWELREHERESSLQTHPSQVARAGDLEVEQQLR